MFSLRKLALLIVFLFSTGFAQVLDWTPYFVTADDTLTIIYNAAEGNGELEGAGPPLYAHTGVITDQSSGPTDWRYVITDWNENTAKNTLQYLGNNLWSMKYHIRSFYGVPESEEILELAFVFRNANGSRVGRDYDGSDIYLPLTEPGLNVALKQPAASPLLAQINDEIFIEAVSSTYSSKLSLFIDGELISETSTFEIEHTYQVTDYGTKWIVAQAEDSEGKTVRDSTYFLVLPELEIAPLPEGIEPGITYTSDTSVTLALYAPHKQYVYVLGDFNDWEAKNEFFMKRTPDSTTYWIEINGLVPAEEYAYQYLIDNELRIADPYTEKILSQWDDGYINVDGFVRYPNLKPFPVGEATNNVSVLQTAQEEYQWKYDDFEKPQKENLIIYEMLIRDFTEENTYQSVIDTLGYLLDLGINVLELMPVNEFEGNESWGYNPSFYFAPDKYYGPKDDLKKLIDTLHSHDIAVVIDMVMNHSYGQSPLVRMYWDAQNSRPAANNPWYNQVSPNPVFSWGYDFNHESEATRYFFDRVNAHWINEYHIDGYRFDFTKGLTNKPGDGSAYDSQRINILKRYNNEIMKVDSTCYVILEHFAPDSEERVLTNDGMLSWENMNYSYNEATMGYNDSNKSNFTDISYKAHGFSLPHLVGYMESHDEERLMFKNKEYGNSSGDYDITEIPTALERVKMAATFFIPVPGPKMIWMFGEVGYDYSIDYDCRVCNKPIRWDYARDPERAKLKKVFRELINLKKNYPVFSTRDFELQVSSKMKRINLHHETMNVVIIGNFGVTPGVIDPQFDHTGTWYNFFAGDSIEVTDVNASMSLLPGQYAIYTTKKLPTPELDITTEVKDGIAVVDEYLLRQNYPNPFNPATTITYQIPESGNVTLKIYDVLGNEVATLVDGHQPQGLHNVVFDASRLASGVYMYKLQSKDFVSVKKMMVLK